MSDGARPVIAVPCFENIPEEMQQCAQWCVWEWEWAKKRQQWAKVPKSAQGAWGVANAPAQWATFEGARVYIQGRAGRTGLAFAFTEGTVGVDFDNVLDEAGSLCVPWVEEMVARLSPTYVERSPRGLGLHLYGFGTYPYLKGQNKRIVCEDGRIIGAEMYGKGHVLTVTGDAVTVAPLARWSKEVIRAHYAAVDMRSRGPSSGAKDRGPSSGAKDRGPSSGAKDKEDGRAREGADFDDDICTVDTVKLLAMHKRQLFREHWARTSEKASDSERGAGIARLCQRAGWTQEEVCAALNKWCDDTGQARYHPVKMAETLAFVFTTEEKKDTISATKDRAHLQDIVLDILGLRVERIIQKGHDTPSYAVMIAGMPQPYLIASYAQFEKRLTWQQLAHSTAVVQGYAAQVPVSSRKWPELLMHLVNMCEPEPLEESDTAVETEEWIAQLIDGNTKRVESLERMSVYDLSSGAFITEDGTQYVRLAELLRVSQLNGIKVSRAEMISRLHAQGWCPPPKSGYSKREGSTVVTVRLWSKPL